MPGPALPYLRLHLDFAKPSSDHLEIEMEEPPLILYLDETILPCFLCMISGNKL